MIHPTPKNPQRPYEICTRCVMDTTVPSIRFDEKGECNYCAIHDELEQRYPLTPEGETQLQAIAARIREAGKGKAYDCICGTSGGRDSTWTLYLAVRKLGLRPLVVHFDNGWNSEIATTNIYNACKILDLDLETYVVDWDEFRDIQKAFLKASTPDVEVPTDVAIHAIMHRFAAMEGIQYILNGHSFRTEGMAPLDWTYIDGRYVAAVHERFGIKPMKTFPNFTLKDYLAYSFRHCVQVVPLLNFYPYDQDKVQAILEKELGWRYYGGHHHESFYTKFIQSYLLPQKFAVDRRRTELSALIRSGYENREEALAKVSAEYPYDERLIDYVIEKFDMTRAEFDDMMAQEPKSFRNYPSYYPLIKLLKWPLWFAMRLHVVDRLLYLKFLG